MVEKVSPGGGRYIPYHLRIKDIERALNAEAWIHKKQ
jgi:hypothetical protein